MRRTTLILAALALLVTPTAPADAANGEDGVNGWSPFNQPGPANVYIVRQTESSNGPDYDADTDCGWELHVQVQRIPAGTYTCPAAPSDPHPQVVQCTSIWSVSQWVRTGPADCEGPEPAPHEPLFIETNCDECTDLFDLDNIYWSTESDETWKAAVEIHNASRYVWARTKTGNPPDWIPN